MATGTTNNPQHTSATVHDRGINSDKSFSSDVLLHPLHKPLLKWQDMDRAIPNNNSNGINLDIEENSPFQEGIIFETIQRLDKMFFQKPKSLEDIIDMGNLIHQIFTQTNGHRVRFCKSSKGKCLNAPIYQYKLKKSRQGIYIAPTSRKYTSIYPKTDSQILKWL